jgi:ABC-type Co2+ transport system permease subunit
MCGVLPKLCVHAAVRHRARTAALLISALSFASATQLAANEDCCGAAFCKPLISEETAELYQGSNYKDMNLKTIIANVSTYICTYTLFWSVQYSALPCIICDEHAICSGCEYTPYHSTGTTLNTVRAAITVAT